ncbi:hypothetical protein AYI70_g4431 [Smittium culicis]|uniref:Uncharacterized protein n=1 Tax=Smittium culicis TaxID=133412 RepID=A0A1R1XZ84_9FUNG|nr:hypothetical protein AYI70_g4431 [Smittium culicis]
MAPFYINSIQFFREFACGYMITTRCFSSKFYIMESFPTFKIFKKPTTCREGDILFTWESLFNIMKY